MIGAVKDQNEILKKLGIASLNPMQMEMADAIANHLEVQLLSPTGTGKTLAFLLPLLSVLDRTVGEVQLLILVPSRELAMQIEQVCRQMGSGFKTNAVYGGRSSSKDRTELEHKPAILIGTPGRVADHIRRGTFSTSYLQTLVLDEFDKSLEVGFADDMSEIISALPQLKRRVLTSATQKLKVPAFVGLSKPFRLNFLSEKTEQLELRQVNCAEEAKLDALLQLLCMQGDKLGIVFCNFRETIDDVSDFLKANSIGHVCFHGGMEQQDRERALLKFRNGSQRLLIATDLAARGIDVPELQFVVHFQLPPKEHEFTHRNGRTARMHSNGFAYVLQAKGEYLPDFMQNLTEAKLHEAPLPPLPVWQTVLVSGGRKDKISKGDIAGLFLKQGGLQMEELGLIELKQDCAFVGVKATQVAALVKATNNSRLKKKKVRVRLI